MRQRHSDSHAIGNGPRISESDRASRGGREIDASGFCLYTLVLYLDCLWYELLAVWDRLSFNMGLVHCVFAGLHHIDGVYESHSKVGGVEVYATCEKR